MCRRDHDVRVRRLHRLLVLLGMMRLVQHPWYRRWRQLLILHSAAHPITSRAHLISTLVAPRASVITRVLDSSFHSYRRTRTTRARIRGNGRCQRRDTPACVAVSPGHTRVCALLSNWIDHRGSPPAFELGPASGASALNRGKPGTILDNRRRGLSRVSSLLIYNNARRESVSPSEFSAIVPRWRRRRRRRCRCCCYSCQWLHDDTQLERVVLASSVVCWATWS